MNKKKPNKFKTEKTSQSQKSTTPSRPFNQNIYESDKRSREREGAHDDKRRHARSRTQTESATVCLPKYIIKEEAAKKQLLLFFTCTQQYSSPYLYLFSKKQNNFNN